MSEFGIDKRLAAGAPEKDRSLIVASLAERLHEIEIRLEGDGGSVLL
jgi:hypothetical protein